MAKFKKLPEVVEAFQFDAYNFNEPSEWPDWAQDALRWDFIVFLNETPCVLTAEGSKYAYCGDWVIQQADGTLAVMRELGFREAYTRVW